MCLFANKCFHLSKVLPVLIFALVNELVDAFFLLVWGFLDSVSYTGAQKHGSYTSIRYSKCLLHKEEFLRQKSTTLTEMPSY